MHSGIERKVNSILKRGFMRMRKRMIFTEALGVVEITEIEAVEETNRSKNCPFSRLYLYQQTWRLKKGVQKSRQI